MSRRRGKATAATVDAQLSQLERVGQQQQPQQHHQRSYDSEVPPRQNDRNRPSTRHGGRRRQPNAMRQATKNSRDPADAVKEFSYNDMSVLESSTQRFGALNDGNTNDNITRKTTPYPSVASLATTSRFTEPLPYAFDAITDGQAPRGTRAARQNQPPTLTLRNEKSLKDVNEEQRKERRSRAQQDRPQAPALKLAGKQQQQQQHHQHDAPQAWPRDNPAHMRQLLLSKKAASQNNNNEDNDEVELLDGSPEKKEMHDLEERIPKKSKKNNATTNRAALHPGERVEMVHRNSIIMDKKTSVDASSCKKRPRSSSRETVQVDSNNDNDTTGQRARDTVAQVEQETSGIMGAVGKFGKSVRTSMAGIARDFLAGGFTSSAGGKKRTADNTPKRGSFGRKGHKKIVPGLSLGKNNSPAVSARQKSNLSSSSELSNKALRTTRSRSAKKEPKEIVIDDSTDDEADENSEIVVPPLAATRIALGTLVLRKSCSVEMENGELRLNFSFPGKTMRKTRRSGGGQSDNVMLAFDLNKDLEQLLHFSTDDVVDVEAGHSCFFAFTVTRDAAQIVATYCESFDTASSEQKNRWIVVEFKEYPRLWEFLTHLVELPCAQKDPLGASEAKEYCSPLCSEENFEENPRKKRKKFDPEFLRNRGEEEVLLVYPFAGDLYKMEKASEGLKELSKFGLPDDLAAVPSDQADVEESGGSRSHTLTISVGDCQRLEPGIFLNDTLIDFFMQWMSRNDKRIGESQTHYFSTHFYSMLCKQGPEGVQRWTAKKRIDIFQKRFIFVPVNKSLHWSLTVIVNPGAIKSHHEMIDKGFGEAGEDPFDQPEDLHRPCPMILFFDSLQCHSKATVSRKLRDWLNAEWDLRSEKSQDYLKSPFNCKSMGTFNPDAPRQLNGYDCGVFVCRNAYAITLLRGHSFSYADFGYPGSDKNKIFADQNVFDYDHGDIDRLRSDMLTLIERLSTLFAHWKIEQQRKRKALRDASRADSTRSGIDVKAAETSTDENGSTKYATSNANGDASSIAHSDMQSPEKMVILDVSDGTKPCKLASSCSPKSSQGSDKVLVDSDSSCDDNSPRKRPHRGRKKEVDKSDTSVEDLGAAGYSKVVDSLQKKHGKRGKVADTTGFRLSKVNSRKLGKLKSSDNAGVSESHTKNGNSQQNEEIVGGPPTNDSSNNIIHVDTEDIGIESTAQAGNSPCETLGHRTAERGAGCAIENVNNRTENTSELKRSCKQSDADDEVIVCSAASQESADKAPGSVASKQTLPLSQGWCDVEETAPSRLKGISRVAEADTEVINVDSAEDQAAVGLDAKLNLPGSEHGEAHDLFDFNALIPVLAETEATTPPSSKELDAPRPEADGVEDDDTVEVLDMTKACSSGDFSNQKETERSFSESTQSSKENLRDRMQQDSDPEGEDERMEVDLTSSSPNDYNDPEYGVQMDV